MNQTKPFENQQKIGSLRDCYEFDLPALPPFHRASTWVQGEEGVKEPHVGRIDRKLKLLSSISRVFLTSIHSLLEDPSTALGLREQRDAMDLLQGILCVLCDLCG